MPTDKKISELPVATTINGTDISVLVDNGTDYQYTFTLLLQFLESNLSGGANITFGTVLPQNTTGNDGDVFVNTSAGSFAQKISGTWIVVYTLPAANAADGTLLYGTGLPGTSTGKNTDSYINTLTGIFYRKSAGSWAQVFSMATGPQGPQGTPGTNGTNGTNGNTVLFGTTNPSNTLTGNNGDFYINTTTYQIYGPKTTGIWGSGTALIGTSIAPGGSTGQVLVKNSNTDFDTGWQNNSFVNLTGQPGDNPNMATALTAKQNTLGYTPENTANKNQANGYAGLDGSGKVTSAQLPGYVDDVLEFANYATLPATGETGKIYVTLDTNNEYRWSGSTYIRLVPSPGSTDAVPEGSTNLYFTVARVLTAVLTGIGFSTSTAITAADTVLQALGKLQAQITSLFKIPTGGTTGQVLAKIDSTDGNTQWITPSAGGGTPGGSTNQLQYNNAGAFAGNSKLTFDGSVLNVNNADLYLGPGTKDASALLQMDSTSKGILVPRMTQAQRQTISSPATGLQVYQTDDGTYGEGLYQYTSGGWSGGRSGVAGSDGQIQYCSGGNFAANANFFWKPTTIGFYIKNDGYKLFYFDSTGGTVIGFKTNGTDFGYIGNNAGLSGDLCVSSVGDLYLSGNNIKFSGSVSFSLPFTLGNYGTNYVYSAMGPSQMLIIYGWGSGSKNFVMSNTGNSGATGGTNDPTDLWQLNGPTGVCFTDQVSWPGGLYAGFLNASKSLVLSGGGLLVPDETAILKMDSTGKGFLPPRMTTTQKNTISAPATGLVLYDNSLNKLCVYTGSAWETVTSV